MPLRHRRYVGNQGPTCGERNRALNDVATARRERRVTTLTHAAKHTEYDEGADIGAVSGGAKPTAGDAEAKWLGYGNRRT